MPKLRPRAPRAAHASDACAIVPSATPGLSPSRPPALGAGAAREAHEGAATGKCSPDGVGKGSGILGKGFGDDAGAARKAQEGAATGQGPRTM